VEALRVTLTFDKKTTRKALKSAKRVKLTLTAVVTDAAGDKTTKTPVVTLKK
jgi:hypothetical protein